MVQRVNMDEVFGEVDHSGADRSSRSVYAAVSIIGVAYFFAFVCYGGTDGLQTAGGGDLPRSCVMAVICITSAASSLLLAPAFVSRLSPNMALCVAWGSHALYAMANLYPTVATLLPAAFVVGATFPAVAVAQGVYTTALVKRWCERHGADAGGEDDMRQAGVEGGDRSRNLESCCCRRRTIDDDSLRRQNVFVVFHSILTVCWSIGFGRSKVTKVRDFLRFSKIRKFQYFLDTPLFIHGDPLMAAYVIGARAGPLHDSTGGQTV